jgi:hypothetical protein
MLSNRRFNRDGTEARLRPYDEISEKQLPSAFTILIVLSP